MLCTIPTRSNSDAINSCTVMGPVVLRCVGDLILLMNLKHRAFILVNFVSDENFLNMSCSSSIVCVSTARFCSGILSIEWTGIFVFQF